MLQRLVFDLWYLFRPPWDTGVPPPELVEVVEGSSRREPLPPGRALDLGCGTGTNVIYLAQHGWQAVGVDYSPRAIRMARRKARAAGAAGVDLRVADVTDLRDLDGPFDLALDMGCFHSLEAVGRSKYAANLARLLRPGGHFPGAGAGRGGEEDPGALYLLYAFRAGGGGPRGVSEAEVRACFAAAFRLVEVAPGRGRPSAWYTFERR